LTDKESEVRTAAVSRIADFSKILESDCIVQNILTTFKALSTDQLVYVRSALAENLLAVCPYIGKANTNDIIIPIFLTLLKDESPEVRLSLFKKLEDLN
jgi:serine/threonine-protein phosphatase 2A regulatory subunit A